ncbi:hypothetical protein HDU93_001438 [Gonapodya sp. JEL0774]|nr:hypothetical protein HDU93_001438 [Gonapodya sp. JEL0774]
MSGSIDGLLPRVNLTSCQLNNGNTNTGLYTRTCDVPAACLSAGESLPVLMDLPNGTTTVSTCALMKSTGGSAPMTASPQTGINYALIGGAAGGGVAVIAAMGITYYIVMAKRKRAAAANATTTDEKEPHWFFLRIAGPLGLENEATVEYSGPPFTVVQRYDAQAPDEMDLVPGHLVQMQGIFRDG